MFFKLEKPTKHNKYFNLRIFNKNYDEIAYFLLGKLTLTFMLDFPSDWREVSRAWFRLDLFFIGFNISIPWPWVSEDNNQCSGHSYGFTVFDHQVHIRYGKPTGKKTSPIKIINLPWLWRFKYKEITSNSEIFPYRYFLKSGEIQYVNAIVHSQRYYYYRYWLPYKKSYNCINVEFSSEIGELTNSWKGGVLACGYELKECETNEQCLKRMERERIFN